MKAKPLSASGPDISTDSGSSQGLSSQSLAGSLPSTWRHMSRWPETRQKNQVL